MELLVLISHQRMQLHLEAALIRSGSCLLFFACLSTAQVPLQCPVCFSFFQFFSRQGDHLQDDSGALILALPPLSSFLAFFSFLFIVQSMWQNHDGYLWSFCPAAFYACILSYLRKSFVCHLTFQVIPRRVLCCFQPFLLQKVSLKQTLKQDILLIIFRVLTV